MLQKKTNKYALDVTKFAKNASDQLNKTAWPAHKVILSVFQTKRGFCVVNVTLDVLVVMVLLVKIVSNVTNLLFNISQNA